MEQAGRTEAQDTKNTVYWLAQPALYTQNRLLRCGTTHSGLSPPISITKKINLPTDHLMGCSFKTVVPASQIYLGLYQADKKLASTRPKFNLQHYMMGGGRKGEKGGEREKEQVVFFF